MAYKAELTKEFETDLDEVLDHISNKLYNPSAAGKIVDKILHIIQILEEDPLSFPLYHDDALAEQGMRYTLVSNYLLFYKFDENKRTVYLSRFLYGRRNISSAF